MISGAGAPNYGDELILRDWLEFLDKYLPNEEIVVETTSTEEENLAHTIVGNNTIAINYLRTIAKNNKTLSFWGQVARGWYFGFGATHKPNITYSLLYSTINSCRHIHLVGGGYIHQRNNVSAFILGAVAGFSKKYNKPLYATGIGMQPMANIPKKYIYVAEKVFTQFKYLEVRDKESYEFLVRNIGKRYNFILGLDDSFIQDVKKNITLSSNSLTIHFSCGYHALPKVIKYIQNNFEYIQNKYKNFFFWECYPKGDEIPYIKIKELFPALKKISINNLLENGIPFHKGDCLVTSRFHPHMMFSRLGGEGVFISDSNYYDIKHNSVIALGSNFISSPEPLNSKFKQNKIHIKNNEYVKNKNNIIKLIYKI